MKLQTSILSLFALLSIACKQHRNTEESKTQSKTKMDGADKVADYLMDWVHAIDNNNVDALEKMYSSNAIKVISADSIIESSALIANSYQIGKNSITSIESLFSMEANKDRSINYELIKYKTEDLKEYTQLVIWHLENGQVIREFEFTERNTPEAKEVDLNEIAERRNLWLELCNANNAEHLVKQLYSESTVYFNHKPLVKGRKDLVKEYDYMNNSNYNLSLKPMKLELVNANFAFEIGQCSGSYNGKYILIWKKESERNWKIYIDSNI